MTYPASPPPPDPQDWLMGGGTKSASFDGVPPLTIEGQIIDLPPLIQKRDFDSGEPQFWPDGRPKMLMQVNVKTDQRDPNDSDDEGIRALYLEFRKAHAVRDAVKASGQKRLEVGGHLSLTYTSDDLAAQKGRGKPPKNFTARYTPPDPFAQVAQQGWGAPQAAPAPAQAAPPVAPPTTPVAPPAVAAAPALDPNLVAFLQSRGIDASNMDQATAEAIAKQIGA